MRNITRNPTMSFLALPSVLVSWVMVLLKLTYLNTYNKQQRAVNQRTKPLASLSFIVSILTYCLPIQFTSIYSRDKKALRKFFKQGDRLGLDIGDLDSVISKRTRNLSLQIIHDDEHILNSFLEKLLSGRYRSLKYKTAWGKDSFLRHLILILQDIF